VVLHPSENTPPWKKISGYAGVMALIFTGGEDRVKITPLFTVMGDCGS